MKRICVIVILILLIVPLFAGKYRIESYGFEISGRTRKNALRRMVGQDEGTIFNSLNDLEAAIENKRQTLLSLRLFKDVQASWSEVSMEDDITNVKVNFIVIGAIAMSISPGFSYNTNTGYNLQAVFVDSNTFGSTKKTMFFFNLYDREMEFENYHARYTASTGFYIGNWDFNLRSDVFYFKPNPSESYMNFTFNTSRIRLKKGSISNSMEMTIIPLSERRTGIRKMQLFQDHLTFSLDSEFTWSVSYRAVISENRDDIVDNLATFGVRYDLDALIPFRMYTGFEFDVHWLSDREPEFETQIMAGSADSEIKWEGDYRYGWSYQIEARAREKGRLYIGGHAEYYKLIRSSTNFTSRILFKSSNYVDESENRKFGSYIRGIRDDNPYLKDADFLSASVLNHTLIYQFLHLKLINFYIGAFVDVAHISPYGMLAGIGAELMIILADWPGDPLTISVGKSLNIDTEYEISLTSGFHY